MYIDTNENNKIKNFMYLKKLIREISLNIWIEKLNTVTKETILKYLRNVYIKSLLLCCTVKNWKNCGIEIKIKNRKILFKFFKPLFLMRLNKETKNKKDRPIHERGILNIK